MRVCTWQSTHRSQGRKSALRARSWEFDSSLSSSGSDRVGQGCVKNLGVVHHFAAGDEQSFAFAHKTVVVDAGEMHGGRPLDEGLHQNERCLRADRVARLLQHPCDAQDMQHVAGRKHLRVRHGERAIDDHVQALAIDEANGHVQQRVLTRGDPVLRFLAEELGPALHVVGVEDGAVLDMEGVDLRAQFGGATGQHHRAGVGELLLHAAISATRMPMTPR
ncbi:unnamed protein product [Brugia timori]|uniref:NAD-specific glutamate dehydrogenase n=1 Tax=Brugia timori TaxID=42155 RepID=A0A0R3QAU5_9BILA|nr:unnamed protein product [Brugia timori]